MVTSNAAEISNWQAFVGQIQSGMYADLVVLDTAGLNSPVDAVSEDALCEKKAEEGFLHDVVFALSDAFIFVVNRINAKEQVALYQLQGG